MKQRIFFTAFFLIFSLVLFSQNEKDSAFVLTYKQYNQLVEAYHPVSKVADLKLKVSEATLIKARGGFDPKLYAIHDQKEFDTKNYFNQTRLGLKVPLPLGLEIDMAYDKNTGIYLNPENKTPDDGLLQAGVKLAVGKGLFIDERRASLKKAKLFENYNQLERLIIYNDLRLNAGQAYWDWFLAYNTLKVIEKATAIAAERFTAIKRNVALGDLASIDTVEASIQLKNRQFLLSQAQLDYYFAKEKLALFLWDENNIPLQLGDLIVPQAQKEMDASFMEPIVLILDSLVINHPVMRQMNVKLDQMEIERRLKVESIKPTLNIKYNALSDINSDIVNNYNSENYKLGLEFSMPIFLRKERGDLRLLKYEMEETQLNYSNYLAEINYKAKTSIKEWNTLKNQLAIYQNIVEDNTVLLNGEKKLFEIGESSLFMINSREQSFINSQIKQIEIYAKHNKALLKTMHSINLLGDENMD